MANLTERLVHDVRLRYPDARVEVLDQVVTLFVGDGWYGEGTWVDEEDELSPARAEEFIAETARGLLDNGWPDEEIWPVCPTDRDHPLQVRMLRGAATWLCSKDQAATTYRLGELVQ